MFRRNPLPAVAASAEHPRRGRGAAATRRRGRPHASRPRRYESIRDEASTLFQDSRLDSDNYTRDDVSAAREGRAPPPPRAERSRFARDDASVQSELPGEDRDPFRGAQPLLASASAPELGAAPTPPGEDENVQLTRAPDWGAVGPLRDPVVGRMHTRQSSRQRARTFEVGADRARAARVRVAAAPPTKSLFSYAVPPPGVSELGAHLFSYAGDRAGALPALSKGSVGSSAGGGGDDDA